MFLIASLATLIFIFLAAMLSAIETAITAASPARIHKLKLSEKKIQKISQLLKIRPKAISTLLIFNSIVNTIATTIATTAFINLYGYELGVIVSSITMSTLIIVFAEVLPKAISVVRAENVLIKTVGMIMILLTISTPINFLLQHAIKIFCSLFHIKFQAEITGEEEVRGIIEHHHAEGNVIKSDKDMLESILDLRNITVSDIMVHRNYMKTINIDLSVSEIIKQVIDYGYSRIPLWKENKENIIGILHVTLLLKSLNSYNFDYSEINIEDFVTKPWFIPESVLVNTQLNSFRQNRYHLAVVIDEYGILQGILTLEDVLEEIVGHISDEYDNFNENIQEIDTNKYLITGSTPIRDINRKLDWDLPYDKATTIAGLLIYEIRRIPEQNEQFELFNLKFSITSKSIHFIKLLTIESIINNNDNH